MVLDFITERDEPQGDITPTLSEVLKEAIDSKTADLRVSLPAEIVNYDKDKMKADVRPLLKKKYRDESVVEMPIIYNVPVAHPRAGAAFIHMPLKKGHNVLLVFSDRSLDKWLSSGGNVDPDDVRMHQLSDAIAYPGLYPFNDNVSVENENDIIVSNENTRTHIISNGHFQVKNQSNELVAVLVEMLETLREAVVYTSTGPQKLRHSNFVNVTDKLKSFWER